MLNTQSEILSGPAAMLVFTVSQIVLAFSLDTDCGFTSVSGADFKANTFVEEVKVSIK